MDIAIYSRKSRITETGESIKHQIELCKAHIANHLDAAENEVVIYEDEGYSGGNKNRPGYARLLADIKRKRIKTVVVYKLDRMSRNVLDFSETLEIFNSYNVSFVSITEHFDTTTPMGRAMIHISSVFAQLERETIGERIRDNKYKLARTGQWLGGPAPYGFQIVKAEYQSNAGNKKTYAKLVQDDAQIVHVKSMFEVYLKTGSLNDVVSYLAKNNIKTNRGAAFLSKSVRMLLANPIYVKADESIYDYFLKLGCDIASDKSEFSGQHSLTVFNKYHHTKTRAVLKDHGEWIVAVAKADGVIDPLDWLATQKYLKIGRDKPPNDGKSRTSLLASLLTCSCCNRKMNVNHKYAPSGLNHYYYRCRSKVESKGVLCNVPNLNGKNADEIVLQEVIAFSNLDKEELRNKVTKKVPRIDDFIDDKQRIEHENLTLKEQINNLTLELSKEPSLSKYLFEQIKALDERIRENEIQLEQYTNMQESEKIKNYNIEIILSNIMNLKNNAATLSLTDKKQILKTILDGVYWDGKEIKLAFKHV